MRGTSYADTGLSATRKPTTVRPSVERRCDGPSPTACCAGRHGRVDGWRPQRTATSSIRRSHPGAGEKCDGAWTATAKDRSRRMIYPTTTARRLRRMLRLDRSGPHLRRHSRRWRLRDTDPSVHPGREACNGRDDNCDGSVPLNERDEEGTAGLPAARGATPQGSIEHLGAATATITTSTRTRTQRALRRKGQRLHGALPEARQIATRTGGSSVRHTVGSVLGISGGGLARPLG